MRNIRSDKQLAQNPDADHGSPSHCRLDCRCCQADFGCFDGGFLPPVRVVYKIIEHLFPFTEPMFYNKIDVYQKK
jgi:hypothetical protein